MNDDDLSIAVDILEGSVIEREISSTHTSSPVQEIKRDIIYRRMNTNVNQRGRNPTRIRAHLLSTIKKTISLLAYQGTR